MVNAMFAMSCLSPRFSIYVRDILDSGAFLYGVVSSAVGVGLIAGTQTVSKFHAQSKKTIVLEGLVTCAVWFGIRAVFLVCAAALAVIAPRPAFYRADQRQPWRRPAGQIRSISCHSERSRNLKKTQPRISWIVIRVHTC